MEERDREALRERARQLEDQVIRIAENEYRGQSAARCAHAELKLKVAKILRERAA